jgi:hypothetical protein
VTTPTEPITNQEIQAIADRVTKSLIDYAITDIRDLISTDGISETISDDKDSDRLDQQAFGTVYELIWDQLGMAAALVRDQILTEAAELIIADNDRQLWATKPGKHWAADLLLAARTTPEPSGDTQ